MINTRPRKLVRCIQDVYKYERMLVKRFYRVFYLYPSVFSTGKRSLCDKSQHRKNNKMNSKLFISVFMLTTIVVVSISMAKGDDAVKVENKNDDSHPINREEIQKYMSMMEKINIDQMLNNTRLMSNNVKCFLNEGPCTAHLREMKSKSV